MLKFTLLSITLLTVFGSAAVSPALADIALAFPDVSTTQIKSLLTAPSLAVLFVSPMMGRLSQRISKKALVLIGLSLYIIGGTGGGMATSFESLFVMRLILGTGMGILMPMGFALIADHYSGQERLQTMGWSSSATNLSGIVSHLLVGYLAIHSWRYGFSIYLIAVPVMILVAINLPRKQNPTASPAGKNAAKLPLEVYLWAIAMMIFMVCIYAIPVNIALFITENHLGASQEAGIAISCLSVTGMIAGMLGHRIKELLGYYFALTMLVLVTLGYILLVNLNSMFGIVLSLMGIGLGSGFLLPFILYSMTSAAQDNNTVGAMGVMAAAASIGQIATPILLDGIGQLMGDTSTKFIFQLVGTTAGLSAIIIAFISYYYASRSNTKPR